MNYIFELSVITRPPLLYYHMVMFKNLLLITLIEKIFTKPNLSNGGKKTHYK